MRPCLAALPLLLTLAAPALAQPAAPADPRVEWLRKNAIQIRSGNPDLKTLYATFSPMGEVAHRTLGKQMYSLGFTAAAGKAGRVFEQSRDLAKPTPGSLEDLMERAGLENALVDFRNPPGGGTWLREPLISRPLGYTEMKGNWSEVLDGMMFIREMTPSTRAGR